MSQVLEHRGEVVPITPRGAIPPVGAAPRSNTEGPAGAALRTGAPVAPFTGGNGEAFAGALWLGSGAGNAPCAKTCPA